MKEMQFAPELYIQRGTRDLQFYEKALGAMELRRFSNDDGSIHVAELSVGDQVFHLHEETNNSTTLCPAKAHCTTVIIGLFVPDVDVVMSNALKAGALILAAARDYEYGYRQGQFKDPFGHVWMIQKKI